MDKTVFKLFFSHIKECAWLEQMGSAGYLLVSLNDSKYGFTFNEGHTYHYSIENLGAPAQSDAADAYYCERESMNIKPVLSNGQWVYFCREDEPIPLNADTYKKNGFVYRVRMLYLYAFSLVFAAVCGYQLYAVGYLESVGYKSGAVSPLTIGNAVSFLERVLVVLKKFVNLLISILNGYFRLWTNALGDSDAIRVFSVLLPITVVLIVIGSFNLDEYLKYRKLSAPAAAPSETEGSNAE